MSADKHADLLGTAIAVTLTSIINPVWTYKLIFLLLKCQGNCDLTADKVLVLSVVLTKYLNSHFSWDNWL